MRKSSILSSALAVAAIGAMSVATPGASARHLSEPPIGAASPRKDKHRRTAGGPTNALKIRRAARKARNVKRNRSMHRG